MAFNLTANLNVALNTGALRAAANQLNSALNTNTQLKLGIDRNSLSGIKQVKSQIEEATNSMESFGRQAGFAAKRFAAFTITAGSMIAFISTMKEAISAAVEFDREMIRLRQVSSDTVQDVAAVADQITNLSKSFGVSSKDLIGVAVVLKQANLSLSETKDALEAMAQAALAPNFDNLKDTTEGAIAIMKQFKVEAKDLGSALGSVNAVAGEFAVEASDIIEAIRKTGGAFKAAGGNLNELIALFTSVRQTTRESAESIGTGLRTIFTRIQRNDTANALKQVGIELRYTANEARALGDAGLENQFVGPYEAIKRLSAGLSELRSTDPRFSAIVEQLGGYRQISKVIPLIQEFATAQKALGVAQAGSVSLAVNAGQAQDALAVKLQKLKESFFEVGRSIVNSPGFRGLTDTFISAATSVLSLVNSLKGLIPLIAAISVVKIGTGIGSFAKGFFSGASSDGRPTAKKAEGGFLRMRTGGIVPGSGTGDKVPALLEPGELVVPRNQVRRTKYYEAGPVKLEKLGGKKDKSSINTLINNDKSKMLNKEDTIKMEVVEKKQELLSDENKKDIYSSYRLEDSDVELYSDPNFRPIMYASDNTKPKTALSTAKALEKYKTENPKFKELSIDYLKKLKRKIAPAEAAWGKKFENITLEKNKSAIQAATRPTINGKMVAESNYPVDTETKGNPELIYGDIKFKTSKEENNHLLSKQLRAKLYYKKPEELGFSTKLGDNVNLGSFEYYGSYDTKEKGKTILGAKGDFLQSLQYLHNEKKLGGPIYRQRFMEGEEVTHRKAFLDNSFNPGMKLKSALQDTPRIIFKRQPKEYEKFPNMDHTSPHFEQFSEMFVGSRKASQFKRAIENQRLYEEAVKNNDLELANKYDKLNKLPANIRLLAAAKAMTSSQEKARTNSFEEGNFDYEKNLLVNFSGKKTTTRHELGAHAVAYGAAKEGSPLANSLFGSIGRRMGAYGKGSGETTLISEMHAHTIQSRKQKDKIDSLREFISSEKMANLYKSEAHATLADSIKSGTEISTAGILGGRHKNIEIDVLKRMMQDAYGDNPEVLAQKMDLLNPTNSSNNVNFGALFSEAKQSRKYAYGGKVQELISGYTEEQRKKFDQKVADAKQILRNAKETGSMNLKSVGFTFLGKKFNLAQKKKEQEKANVKPLYDLKGAKSLEEFLSKIPSNYVEELKAKIGRAQDKFISTKNIKDLKFAYDFGDRRGPLNIQLEKDLIKFGSIASFPWKPKTPKEKRAEALRIATEKNAVKKRVRKSLAEERRSKAETASSLNELISSIEKENKEESIYQIARPTKVFEGSEQYKEIQRKLGIDRQRQEREKLASSREEIENATRELNLSQFSRPEQKTIGIKEDYSANKPVQTKAPIGTSPQALRLQQQFEEKEIGQPDIYGIAKNQSAPKQKRKKKTEGEKYNLLRRQSAPTQERTLFDESQLSNIGTYGVNEPEGASTTKLVGKQLIAGTTRPEAFSPLFRLRSRAKESVVSRLILNERQLRRRIANENLEENLRSLRFAGGGLVPGTGNSDTVPMDLPEGSFVIRKSSVNKIGADNLARASKFASGGTVPALLTPGEYVYSPEEANKIGPSRLHSMNRFAKFARGGPIGLSRSGKFDANDPKDIEKLKETLEEQLRYEDPNKDEATIQIEVKQQTDEIQRRQNQYTSDEMARQADESKVNSANALVSRQQSKVNVQQDKVNLASNDVAAASKAKDKNEKEARAKAQEEAKYRSEASKQQTKIRTLTAAGAAPTDPRLVAANAALVAATNSANAAMREKNRAISAASAADVQLTKNTNILNAENAKLAQEQRMLGLAQKNAVNATNAYTASTLKAEKSAALLDEYQQDASGKVLLAGKVIGETKPLSGKGSVEDILKQKEKEYASDFKRKPGKDEREMLKSDIIAQYRESVGKQLRAKAEKEGKPISEISLQASVEQYTQEFARGKRRGIFEKGQMLGDLDVGSKLERGGSYKASGELTTKGKLQDLGYRAIFGSRRTDFEAGPEGEKQFVQARGQNIANKLTTLAVGANLIGGQIKERAGTGEGIVSKGEGDTVKVDEAAASALKASYGFGQALSSASTYAATAAQSLAQFGPVVAGFGAGIAGIVGAFEGYHNGIKEAEAKIREAKIAQALNNLQNIFERVSNGLLEVNDSTLRRISENQAVLAQENQVKAYEESGGNASAFQAGLFKLSGGLIGKDVDQAKLNESLKRSRKETEAAQLVPLTNVLNKFSQDIGKNEALRIKSTGGDLATTNFEDIRGGLLEKLRSSGGGAGREQIARIASAQDITIQDAEKQFIKTLQESFQAEKIKNITTKSIQENARAINSMEALSNAVIAAAASADSFSSKLDTNAALFEGSIGSTKLTSFSEKYGGTTPDFSVFNNAITESAGILGAYGQQFKAQGNAVNVATQILPDILANSVENPISGKDTATQITDALKEGLKQRGITGTAAEQVVSSVGGKVSAEEFTKLLAEAGGDVSKASKKLISDISGPLISAFNEIDNKLTDAGNKYISGLEELAKRQKAIGDQIGRLSELRSRSRSFMASEIQRLPGVRQGVAETINLRGARQDFSEQQQRLTGFGAGAAENPAAIASRLAKTQEQIRAQEQKVQATSKSSNAGADFRNAALELTKLKSQASNLNDALKNLTDQSKKLEAAQAKLAQVRQGIDEKRSLGRKLLTQSPEEQQKMLQGQQLFNIVKARGGSVAGLSTEQNAVLFDFLDNFGSAGKKIADQILDVSGYGAGKDDMSEEKALVAEQARIFAQQEEAQKLIISNQESLQQDYFSNLDSRNEKFYSELQKFIQELQKNQLISEKLGKQQEISKIKDVQKEGKFLGAAGFNTKEDFEKLNTYKGQVVALAKNKQEEERIKKLGGITDFEGKVYGGVLQNPLELEAKLAQAGYKSSEATKVRELTQERISSGSNNPLAEAIRIFKSEKKIGLSKEKEKLQTEIKGSGAEDKLNKLANSLAKNEISFEQFDRATASIKELQLVAGQGLSTAADAATERLNILNGQINQLGGIQVQAPAPVQVGGFAVGGSVFKPRGTDTVPAMLTPGEFVVNKNATQKNLPLLQSINSGKTSYLANGGMVQYYQNAGLVVGPPKELSEEYPEEDLNKINNSSIFNEEYKNIDTFWPQQDYSWNLGISQNPVNIIDYEFDKYRKTLFEENLNYGLPKLIYLDSFLSLVPNSPIWKGIQIEQINKSKQNFNKDIDNFEKNDKFVDNIFDKVFQKSVTQVTGIPRGIGNLVIGQFGTQFLDNQEWKNNIEKSQVSKIYQSLRLDQDEYGDNVSEWFVNLNESFIKNQEKKKKIANQTQEEQKPELGPLNLQQLGQTALQLAPNVGEFFGRVFGEQKKLVDLQKSFSINTKEGRLKTSKEIFNLSNKGFIDSGMAKEMIKGVNSGDTKKLIELQDQLYFKRKLSSKDLSNIFMQRQAQAQTLVGVIAEYTKDRNMDRVRQVDPRVLFESGQLELNNIIDQKPSKITDGDYVDAQINENQTKIISSYIRLKSFENASRSKGKEFSEIIDWYGKEGVEKDPQAFIEKASEKIGKDKKLFGTISGKKEFLEANIQGKFNFYKLLKEVTKPYNISDSRLKKAANSGVNVLDRIIENQRKAQPSFIRDGILQEPIQNDYGQVLFANDPANDPKVGPPQVNFLDAKYQSIVPSILKDKSIEQYFQQFADPSFLLDQINKTMSINQVLPLIIPAELSKGFRGMSKFGYLSYPIEDTETAKAELVKKQARYKIFSINKEIDGKKSFERFADNILFEGEKEVAKIAEVQNYIRNLNSNKNQKQELNTDIFGVTEEGSKTQVGKAVREVKELRNAFFIANQDSQLFEEDIEKLSKRTTKYFKFASYASLEPNDMKETNFLLSELEILKNGYNLRLKEIYKNQPEQEIDNKSKGGLINYLSGGGVPSYAPNPNPSFFKPKGTDTVPAMLSPGEFVINAAATAKHSDLLNAINNGEDVGYSSTGGMTYLEDGGEARKKAFYEKMNRQKRYEEEGVNLVDDKDKYSYMQERKDFLESVKNKATQKFDPETLKKIKEEELANEKALHTFGYMGLGFNLGRAFITQGVKAISGHGIKDAAKHFSIEAGTEIGQEVGVHLTEKSLNTLFKSAGGLIKYLAYGGSTTSFSEQLKKTGFDPKHNPMEDDPENLIISQKSYENFIATYDAQLNQNRELKSKIFELSIGSEFFKGPDANKKEGIKRVGDTGVVAGGPEELVGYFKKSKTIQMPVIKMIKPEVKERKRPTAPLEPPPTEPKPPTQGSQSKEGDLTEKELKEAKAALHAGGQQFVNNAQVRAKAKEIKELDAQIAIWQAELENQIAGLSKGGMPKSRTDTIPAMLTPGEFVVNAKSSAKNSSLLHAINSGKEIEGFAQGGVVGYYAGGKTSGGRPSDRFNVAANMFSQSVSRFDSVLSKINAPTNSGYISIAKSSFDELSRILKTEIKVSSEPIKDFDRAVNNFGQNTTGFINNFGSSLEKFKGYINELNTVINTIPSTINLEVVGNLSASLNVDFNTQSVFLAVTNAVESLKGFIVSEIDKQINDEMF